MSHLVLEEKEKEPEKEEASPKDLLLAQKKVNALKKKAEQSASHQTNSQSSSSKNSTNSQTLVKRRLEETGKLNTKCPLKAPKFVSVPAMGRGFPSLGKGFPSLGKGLSKHDVIEFSDEEDALNFDEYTGEEQIGSSKKHASKLKKKGHVEEEEDTTRDVMQCKSRVSPRKQKAKVRIYLETVLSLQIHI